MCYCAECLPVSEAHSIKQRLAQLSGEHQRALAVIIKPLDSDRSLFYSFQGQKPIQLPSGGLNIFWVLFATMKLWT